MGVDFETKLLLKVLGGDYGYRSVFPDGLPKQVGKSDFIMALGREFGSEFAGAVWDMMSLVVAGKDGTINKIGGTSSLKDLEIEVHRISLGGELENMVMFPVGECKVKLDYQSPFKLLGRRGEYTLNFGDAVPSGARKRIIAMADQAISVMWLQENGHDVFESYRGWGIGAKLNKGDVSLLEVTSDSKAADKTGTLQTRMFSLCRQFAVGYIREKALEVCGGNLITISELVEEERRVGLLEIGLRGIGFGRIGKLIDDTLHFPGDILNPEWSVSIGIGELFMRKSKFSVVSPK